MNAAPIDHARIVSAIAEAIHGSTPVDPLVLPSHVRRLVAYAKRCEECGYGPIPAEAHTCDDCAHLPPIERRVCRLCAMPDPNGNGYCDDCVARGE
jgi:hypothetical protein